MLYEVITVAAIRPNTRHVATEGFACVKGLKQMRLYDSPDRLTRRDRANISAYAQNRDYHDIVKGKLVITSYSIHYTKLYDSDRLQWQARSRIMRPRNSPNPPSDTRTERPS